MLSENERAFVLRATKEGHRIDGRSQFQFRPFHLSISKDGGTVEVQLGQTRIMAAVSAELASPYPDRANEGSLAIFTEFSPMADPVFEPGRPGEAAVELGRIIDRGLRESRAIDMESLCIVPGRTVWSLRVDCHILDNGGNLIDAANIAILAALLSFRRPECTLGGDDGQQVVVHSIEERDPIPLAIHHLPISVTFAFFNDGVDVLVDPNSKEEAVMGGRMTLTVNTHSEICAIQKGGGVGVQPSEILRCLRIARNRVGDVAATLKREVESHDKQRQELKVKRKGLAATSYDSFLQHEVVVRDRLAWTDQPAVPAVDKQEAVDAELSKVEHSVPAAIPEKVPEGEDVDMDGSEEEESDEDVDVSTSKTAPLFTGGKSSWLEEDLKPRVPKGKLPFDASAMDEFEKVAAMLSSASNGRVAAASVYSAVGQRSVKEDVRDVGGEEVVVLKSEFTLPASTQERGAHQSSSLADAVKGKKNRRKNKGKQNQS